MIATHPNVTRPMLSLKNLEAFERNTRLDQDQWIPVMAVHPK
jgi:hypothetical protein